MEHGPLRRESELAFVRLLPRSDTMLISRGRTVLVTGRNGWITEGQPEQGLFVAQARLLSRYEYLIDGEPPLPVALSNVQQDSSLGYYIHRPPWREGQAWQGQADVDPAQESLELRVTRSLAEGIHEDLDFTNYTRKEVRFRFTLRLETDFMDQEAAGRRGRLSSCGPDSAGVTYDWRHLDEDTWELEIDYRASRDRDAEGRPVQARLHRGLLVRLDRCSSPPSWHWADLSFEVAIAPAGTWHTCVHLLPTYEGRALQEVEDCHSLTRSGQQHDRKRDLFDQESTRFRTSAFTPLEPIVTAALNQAARDLDSLRLDDLDEGDESWTVAAGVPLFMALFGRDTLTAAWQAGLLNLGLARGTLAALAREQGRHDDPWRDEQPGRMIHEAHTSPGSQLQCNPRGRYYGSLTSSSFYSVLLGGLWHWTGDAEQVRPFLEPALEALAWMDRDSKRDGFYFYKTRSSQGLRNQSWKDSDDAMVWEDGSEVEPPLATCEEQGFVFAARLQLAEILWSLDRKDEARTLFQEALTLRDAFNEAFWMEDEGFYCMALDARGRQVRTIASNPGHCLATGLVPRERRARVARRLMAEDLFSGWGIRTLSSRHPAYNPYSYHRGSVWPVEQGTFSLGLARCGLHEEAARLARSQFEAASLFEYHRLPEVLGGHPRDELHPFPALYPRTNYPQAWSASSLFLHVQALLGLQPYAPLRLLLVDPRLPEWLPQLVLENLRVGEARVSLRFFRLPSGDTAWEILEREGPLQVVQLPAGRPLLDMEPGHLLQMLRQLRQR